MDLGTIMQGLAITVVGMALVFLALGLIVLAMMLMGRFLRPGSATKEQESTSDPEAQQRAKVAAMVAAMAAGIVIAQHQAELPDGGAWHPVPSQAGAQSPWLASHRARALARRSQFTRGEG